MSNQKFKTWLYRGTLVAAAIGASACAGDEEPTDDLRRSDQYIASLQSFSSCEALDDYLVDVTAEQVAQSYVDGWGYDVRDGGVDFAQDDTVAAPTAEGGGETNGPTDFTTTNVQEAGVDEPDLLKTNGQHTYVLTGQTLRVLDSFPVEETHEVATVDLEGYGDNMFLVGDRIVVMRGIYTGQYYDTGGDRGEPEPDVELPDAPVEPGEPGEPVVDPLDDGTYFEGTRVTVIDVSEPTAPSIERRFDIQGNYTTARLVDGIVYLVTNTQADYSNTESLYQAFYDLDLPELSYDASEAERDAARARVYAAALPLVEQWVDNGGRDGLLPDVRTADGRSELFACTDIMRPNARAGVSILGVTAFDPANSGELFGSGVMANGWQVYGSANALYVAQDSRWWSWFNRENAYAQTQIHRFSLNGGDPIYTASGSVDGWILNQFSMSEHEDYLRVATTDQTSWGWGGGGVAVGGDVAVADGGSTEPSTTVDVDAPPEVPAETDGSDEKQNIVRIAPEEEGDANNVFVLQQNGNSLDVVSGIRGIAPTERIYSVRFVGDTGYVVTFRQTDPLYVIDFSDPTAPIIDGELHIPGFSTYLHPFGDGYLIGVGRDGDEEGRVGDFQVQLFDVRDPANPTRIHQTVLETGASDGWGWSNSEAEHDHRAFTFYESRNLLAIPITLENYDGEGAYRFFSGAIVFEVSAENGFVEQGRVSHSHMPYDEYCGGSSDVEEGSDCAEWGFPWYINMRRTSFIDDYLLAFSESGTTVSEIGAIDEVVAEVRY
jgi:uncharacterized secreted protein with C-terminal beta-propeller domain